MFLVLSVETSRFRPNLEPLNDLKALNVLNILIALKPEVSSPKRPRALNYLKPSSPARVFGLPCATLSSVPQLSSTLKRWIFRLGLYLDVTYYYQLSYYYHTTSISRKVAVICVRHCVSPYWCIAVASVKVASAVWVQSVPSKGSWDICAIRCWWQTGPWNSGPCRL